MLLTIRKVRTEVQKESEKALAQTDHYLAEERLRRIKAEQDLYEAILVLTLHGIKWPERTDEPNDTSQQGLP